MWFSKKTPKRSDDESFLIAHIIRGSGSVSSLLHYIKNHPGGGDAAREDIIRIKYWYSKCTPVVKTIVRKMVTSFEYFSVEKDEFRGLFSDDTVEHFKVVDMDNSLWFRCDSKNPVIEIENDGVLSSNRIDWIIFLYALRSVMYIKKNIAEMKKSQRTENTKTRYMESYR